MVRKMCVDLNFICAKWPTLKNGLFYFYSKQWFFFQDINHEDFLSGTGQLVESKKA